jgi:hypothetical protein
MLAGSQTLQVSISGFRARDHIDISYVAAAADFGRRIDDNPGSASN